MDNHQKEKEPLIAQSRAGEAGANLTDVLAADRAYGELIRIAARLVLRQDLPSDCADDYKQKTISTRKVAKMMEKSHRAQVEMGAAIRNAADALKAANLE